MVADDFPEVTVLFCEICNFHSFASRYDAHTVISVLNIIYSKFDSLIDKYKVHKVRRAWSLRRSVDDVCVVPHPHPHPTPHTHTGRTLSAPPTPTPWRRCRMVADDRDDSTLPPHTSGRAFVVPFASAFQRGVQVKCVRCTCVARAWQVETVGEVYMVVAGCPTPTPRHAERACRMALAMCDCLEPLRRDVEAKLGVPSKELNIRVGLNTGPIVAGVVGISNPRYDPGGG